MMWWQRRRRATAAAVGGGGVGGADLDRKTRLRTRSEECENMCTRARGRAGWLAPDAPTGTATN